MSYTYLALSILALALSALARPNGQPRAVDLAEAMNKSVCPIVVEIDENPHRVPRKIKMLKCAPQPNHWCAENGIPHRECCHHSHVMECVEIRDKVLVYDNRLKRSMTHEVSVGCTCMIEQSTQVPELLLSPT